MSAHEINQYKIPVNVEMCNSDLMEISNWNKEHRVVHEDIYSWYTEQCTGLILVSYHDGMLTSPPIHRGFDLSF
jgi:hypothetical protein